MDTLSPGATVKVPWNSKVQVLYGQLWLFMSNIASKRKSSHLVQGIDPSSYQEQGATLKQCGLKNSHVTKMIHFGSSCSVYKCSLYSPNLRGKWSPLTQTPRMKVWVSHQVSSSVLQRWEVGWRTDVKRRTMMSRDVSGAATGAEVARACATAFCSWEGGPKASWSPCTQKTHGEGRAWRTVHGMQVPLEGRTHCPISVFLSCRYGAILLECPIPSEQWECRGLWLSLSHSGQH